MVRSMNATARHILTSSVPVIALLAMFVCSATETTATSTAEIGVLDVSVSLSAQKITPDDSLNISIRATLDWGSIASITPGENQSDFLTMPSATIMLSSVDTGSMVLIISKNLSYDGSAYYNYTPKRPIEYGRYMVWATAGNRSAFADFLIEPSALDLLNQMSKMQDQNTKALAQDRFVTNFVFPFVFIMSASFVLSLCLLKIFSSGIV